MPESFTLEEQTLFTQERQFAFPLISLVFTVGEKIETLMRLHL